MPSWKVDGEYFENCNCDVLCPCITTNLQGKPTQGHCDVVLAYHIATGKYDGVKLDGLNAVMAATSPGAMALGNWKVAVYLDRRGSPEQRKALEAIFTGAAGGPMAAFSPFVGEILGAKVVPITYESSGTKRRVAVEGIMDLSVEGILGADGKSAMVVDNVAHPCNSSLAIAQGVDSRYTDHGMRWEISGKNGHYSPIHWEVK
ncbi:MAG: hypothetical protein A2Z40_03735 [Deltaproteobacteria bacterium RBG_19FT_COMBO_60_16]|nr:MAG: hypothetical protein A2Z40_03735 [Deltaproteobacteria bacterium RBG_19FT_COMBO_60_16]